jgi:hypothetical protein
VHPRPSSLQLDSVPSLVFSSPDGSCLLAYQDKGRTPTLTAYHWNTFGSTAGIPLPIPNFPLQSAVLTSLVSKSNVHLVGIDVNSHCCQSIALKITGQVTELAFQQKGGKRFQQAPSQTEYNCLIDCHSEVWTRYPVKPAIGRRTITSESKRLQKKLTFVTDYDRCPLVPYFAELIRTFEDATKKPVDKELSSIQISVVKQGTLRNQLTTSTGTGWNISEFRAGEWIVDFLCLIPIHLAVCRENRFIPLKDGVYSSELERTLLGAEIDQIVDNLSFGWYESLFQSYMASKVCNVLSFSFLELPINFWLLHH